MKDHFKKLLPPVPTIYDARQTLVNTCTREDLIPLKLDGLARTEATFHVCHCPVSRNPRSKDVARDCDASVIPATTLAIFLSRCGGHPFPLPAYLFAPFLLWLPPQPQRNAHWIALLLPVQLAFAAVLLRTGRPPTPAA